MEPRRAAIAYDMLISPKAMLEVKDVRKSYGSVTAVDGVSFRAETGETVGLLGPNGAGKTTTVSMIAGLLRPDAGEILISGRPLRGDTDAAKREIGLVPQDIGLYDELTARDNLTLFASLYGLTGSARKKPIEEALDLVGLTDRAKDKVAGFSGGMKRPRCCTIRNCFCWMSRPWEWIHRAATPFSITSRR